MKGHDVVIAREFERLRPCQGSSGGGYRYVCIVHVLNGFARFVYDVRIRRYGSWTCSERQVHTIEAIPHFFVHSTSILAFRPYADLVARAYAVSASRKTLANRPFSKPVRTCIV